MPDLSQFMQGFGDVNRTPYGSGQKGFTGMMQGIMNSRDRGQQIKSWDAVAKAIRKATEPDDEIDLLTGEEGPTKPHPLGDVVAWNNASALDRINKAKGVLTESILKSAMKDQQQKQQESALKIGLDQQMNPLRVRSAELGVKSAMKDQQQKQQESALKIGLDQQMNPLRVRSAELGVKGLESEQADEAALQSALEAAAPGPEAPKFPGILAPSFNAAGTSTVPGGNPQKRTLDALLNSGRGLASNRAANLLRAMEYGQRMQPGATSDFIPQSFEVGGVKGIVSPRTGSIHVQGGGQENSFEQRLQLLDRKGLLDEKRALIAAHGRTFVPKDKQYYQDQIDAIDARLAASDKSDAPARQPKPGEIRKGYRFKGGDPAKKESWERAQ